MRSILYVGAVVSTEPDFYFRRHNWRIHNFFRFCLGNIFARKKFPEHRQSNQYCPAAIHHIALD